VNGDCALWNFFARWLKIQKKKKRLACLLFSHLHHTSLLVCSVKIQVGMGNNQCSRMEVEANDVADVDDGKVTQYTASLVSLAR
jgi:hypothetical protein